MKQVLTPEDINFLEKSLQEASPSPWNVIEEEFVDTAWVVPSTDGNPVALFDYRSSERNKADAHFVASARNYMKMMLEEIKNLRNRVLELIQSNNIEVQKRMDIQTELYELKEMLKNTDENK